MNLLAAALSMTLQPYVASGVGELNWDIAGLSPLSEDFVDVLSELNYEELEYTGLGLRGSARLALGDDSPWFLSAQVDGMDSDIDEGRYRDSDYDGSGRTRLFSLSEGDVPGRRNTYISGALGLGYRFSPQQELQVLLGGYRARQKINFTNGFQVVPASGAFPGLDSDYNSQWRTATLGALWRYQFSRYWGLQVEGQWLLDGSYEARARWNLRDDFAQPTSFIHDAEAEGGRLRVQGDFALSTWCRISASWQLEDLQTEAGLDRTFLADDSTADTPLNGVQWRAATVNLGLEFSF